MCTSRISVRYTLLCKTHLVQDSTTKNIVYCSSPYKTGLTFFQRSSVDVSYSHNSH